MVFHGDALFASHSAINGRPPLTQPDIVAQEFAHDFRPLQALGNETPRFLDGPHVIAL